MNYYKITNEKEIHDNMQYKDGLNVDVLPWNPKGDCQKGGIYFASTDILAFLDYGCWIRKVEVPEGVEIYENPGDPKKYKAPKVFLHPRRKIDTNVIKELIDEGADLKVCGSTVLRWAAENGHAEIVKMLLPHSDPKACDSAALRWAAENGNAEIVKMLLPVSDPKACGSVSLIWAAESGHAEIVKMLLPVSDLKDCEIEALRRSAINGHTEIVEMIENYKKGGNKND